MKKIIIFIGIFILFYLILFFMNKNYYENNGVPIMNIDLKDTDINFINTHDKEKKYDNNNIMIKDGFKTFRSKVMIKGRGNYTWTLDKKPYQIAFDEETSILNLPKSKKYILLANYTDSSLLKNDFSYSVAENMKLNYSFTGKYIDLYIDHNYIGNYYVTPKIGINDATVNLKNKKAIIMELDNSYYDQENEKDVFISNIFKDHLVLKDSESKTVYDDMKVFKDKYNDMEEAIDDKDYNELDKLVDLDSFAKYYIISEFSENSDALRSSLFFYMDGYEDKIHIGPLWDCDIGYGLKPQYSDYNKFPIRDNLFEDEDDISVLFYELLKIDDFNKLVKKNWNDIGKKVYKEEIKQLDNTIKYLNKSGTYNNIYWNKASFNGSGETLKDWINKRYKVFNKEYYEKN